MENEIDPYVHQVSAAADDRQYCREVNAKGEKFEEVRHGTRSTNDGEKVECNLDKLLSPVSHRIPLLLL